MNTFYRDPRLLILTIVLIVVSGVSSFYVSPRMEDPVLTERAGIINTRLLGADANRIDALVSEKLIEKLRSIDEIKEIRSTSRPNISTIAIILKDDVQSVDEVWSRIRDKLTDARPSLPIGTLPPDLQIVKARSYAYIAALRWTPDAQPNLSYLRRIARELQEELRGIPSTEQVDLFGAPEEEMLIDVSPQDLANAGLSIASLHQQVVNADPKIPTGQLRSDTSDLVIEMGNQLDSADRIGRLVIRTGKSGQTLYLSDIAQIKKAAANPPRSLALVEGEVAILVAATISPTARIDFWTQKLNRRMDAFRQKLPSILTLSTVFEQNATVETRIHSLIMNLVVSALTVVLVVFIMMGWRSAWIVGLTLPFASLMVFTGLRFLNIPLHQMSLSALVIALGMLEGTAIIIVDEVQRRIREGSTPESALTEGVSHMALPLFGSTITTVLSFAPIAIMPGPSGEFVGSIGTSVILALGCSLALSFTIIPTLSALFTSPEPLRGGFMNQGFSNRSMSRVYRSSLRFCFERPWLGLVGGIGICLPGFAVLPLLPEQFFPAADRGQFHIEMDLSAQASIQQTERVARDIRMMVLKHQEVASVDWVLGESAPSFYYNVIGRLKDSSRYGQAIVQLKQGINARDLIRSIQSELDASIPDALIRVRQLEQGPPFNAPVEVRWFGPDAEKLRELGDATRQILGAHPNVISTQSDQTDSLAKVVMQFDENATARAGLNLNSIARQLDANLEGRLGGTMMEGNEELPLRIRVQSADRQSLSQIESLELRQDLNNSTGQGTPVSALGTAKLRPELAAIARLDGRKMNEVRGYLVAGVLPSTVLKWFKRELAAGKIEIPDGYTMEFGGEASKRNEALGQLTANIGMIIAATIFVLVFSLKSFRASAIIIGVGGLSVGFGILGLWLGGFPFGFTAVVGAMGMIGVAINDSIVVLADLRSDEKSANGDMESVLDIVMRSTRHVLATTFTVAVGFVPLVMEGGTFWPPMAMVISAGVIGATILAIYSVPSIHLLMTKKSAPRRPNRQVSTENS